MNVIGVLTTGYSSLQTGKGLMSYFAFNEDWSVHW